VAADACRPRSGGRLRARFLGGAGEGGVAIGVFLGWFDRQRGEACAFRPATDGRVRCLPTSIAADWAVRYEDAACTKPTAVRDTGSACAPGPRYATVKPQPDCGQANPAMLWPVGEGMPATRLFRRAGGECVPDDFAEPLRRLGPPVAPAAFVAASASPGAAGRITADALTAADGAVQPCGGPEEERLDRDRGERCLPLATADGKQRCLPVGAARAPIEYGFYTDADCRSAKVVSGLAGCADPSLYVHMDHARADCFLDGRNVAQVVPLSPYAGPTYAPNDIGDCVTAPPPPGAKLWSLGPKLADATFVEAALVEVPATGRLRARMWQWEGGLRQWSGLFTDAARGEPCRPLLAADGKLRCLPGREWPSMEAFRDAACTQPARWVPLDPCAGDRSVLETIFDACGSQRVYPLERLPGSALRAPSPTGCNPAPGMPAEVGVLGAEIPPAELVELVERIE